MRELKPCPFCGGEATIFPYLELGNLHMVKCRNCNISRVGKSEGEAVKEWNTRANPWHTGTPTVDDPFLIKEVFILLFIHPSGETRNYRAEVFKPDFKEKCFYAWRDKRIKFPFDTEGLLWQKIEPYKEENNG